MAMRTAESRSKDHPLGSKAPAARNAAPQRGAAAGRRGFSLVELIVAIVFLAIGLLGVAAVFPLGTRSVNQAKLTSAAVALAAAKMEELESAPRGSPALAAGTYTDTRGVFTREWVIQDDVPIQGMKRVRVRTTWQGPRGARQVELETYIFN